MQGFTASKIRLFLALGATGDVPPGATGEVSLGATGDVSWPLTNKVTQSPKVLNAVSEPFSGPSHAGSSPDGNETTTFSEAEQVYEVSQPGLADEIFRFKRQRDLDLGHVAVFDRNGRRDGVDWRGLVDGYAQL